MNTAYSESTWTYNTTSWMPSANYISASSTSTITNVIYYVCGDSYCPEEEKPRSFEAEVEGQITFEE